jgi:hypothetical protein
VTDADRDALEALADRRDFRLLADETFRDADSALAGGTLAARGPRWVCTSSLTKAYGLGGLRIGWVAADPATLERCAEVHDQLSAVPSSLSIGLASALLPHLDALRARTHRILAGNRPAFHALLDRRPAVRLPAPSRGTTAWLTLGDGDAGDAFAAFALERHALLLVPGSMFGDPSGVRVTLGAEPEAFARALDRLDRAAGEWSDPSPGATATPGRPLDQEHP